MATLDLTDAFLLIPVATPYKKYLRFMFKGNYYEFNCVPFGLCTAPFVFTKLMKPVVENLRSRSLLSVVYLDDFLLIGKTKEECLKNIKVTRELLQNLGFIVNLEKSNIIPTKKVKYLGFNWNTRKMIIELTTEKKETIYKKAKEFYHKKNCKIRELAQFLGSLIASCPAVKYGNLYTKSLEREKYLSLIKENGNFESKMNLPDTLLPDLEWWIDNIFVANYPIKTSEFSLEIFSDASLTGWGAVAKDDRTHG